MKKLFLIPLMLLATLMLTAACSEEGPTPDEQEQTIIATMEDNCAARNFLSRLSLVVTLEDYNNGTEKIFYRKAII